MGKGDEAFPDHLTPPSPGPSHVLIPATTSSLIAMGNLLLLFWL